jgi:hypothetical protein
MAASAIDPLLGAAIAVSCGSHGSPGANADAGDSVLDPPPPDEGFQLAADLTSPAYSETWQCFVQPFPVDGAVP